MRLISNHLLVEWLPIKQVGAILTDLAAQDYYNVPGAKMYKVLAAGPGRLTKKGVFVPNEIVPGDNVIVWSATGAPELLPDGKRFVIRNTDEMVLARVPVQPAISITPPPPIPSESVS